MPWPRSSYDAIWPRPGRHTGWGAGPAGGAEVAPSLHGGSEARPLPTCREPGGANSPLSRNALWWLSFPKYPAWGRAPSGIAPRGQPRGSAHALTPAPGIHCLPGAAQPGLSVLGIRFSKKPEVPGSPLSPTPPDGGSCAGGGSRRPSAGPCPASGHYPSLLGPGPAWGGSARTPPPRVALPDPHSARGQGQPSPRAFLSPSLRYGGWSGAPGPPIAPCISV